MRGISVLITDKTHHSDQVIDHVLFWGRFEQENTTYCISITQLVELKSDKYKKQYLKFIHNIGHAEVNGSSLNDELELDTGFSYWWMTLLHEKCNIDSTRYANDIIKFYAFEDWAKTQTFDSVIIDISNKPIMECLTQFFKIKYKNIFISILNNRKQRNKFQLLQNRKYINCKGFLVFILKILCKSPLILTGRFIRREFSGEVLVLSYLISRTHIAKHFDVYINPIKEILKSIHMSEDWLYINVRSSSFYSLVIKALNLVEWNRNCKDKQTITTLDAFINTKILISVIRDWCKLLTKYSHLTEAVKSQIDGNQAHIWLLVEPEWEKSFSSQYALNNLLYYYLFKTILSRMKKKRLGIFLQENVHWEPAFMYHWRYYGHGVLVGVAHACIRYWDLRYFQYNNDQYQLIDKAKYPFSDYLVFSTLAQSTINAKTLAHTRHPVCLESLRYHHLYQRSCDLHYSKNNSRVLRILVLTDYDKLDEDEQLAILDKALARLAFGYTVTLRQHPSAIHRLGGKQKSSHVIDNISPMKYLLRNNEIVYTGNVTTSILEALEMGLFVISYYSYQTVNLSPLRSCEDVNVVSNHIELTNALNKYVCRSAKSSNGKKYMLLDPSFSGWIRFLSNLLDSKHTVR